MQNRFRNSYTFFQKIFLTHNILDDLEDTYLKQL